MFGPVITITLSLSPWNRGRETLYSGADLGRDGYQRHLADIAALSSHVRPRDHPLIVTLESRKRNILFTEFSYVYHGYSLT